MKRVVQGYQRGCLRVRNGCFELLYRDCIVGSDGRIHRPRRTVRLGPEEIGAREAERLRDEVLAKIDNQKEARREITFGEFVNGPFFEQRQTVLDVAYRAHPERFVRQAPKPPSVPTEVWINKPTDSDEKTH